MTSPAFQFYVQDFLTGTMHMSAEEIGAYVLLLCHQWDKGALPPGDKELLRIARTKIKVLEMVKAKFALCEDNMLRNERLEKEREKQAQWRLKSAEAGKKSGEVRRTKMNQPSPMVETIEEANGNSSSSISTSISSPIHYINKNVRVGNQVYEKSAGALMMELFPQGITELMMNQYRTLRVEDVLAEVELQCPSGTIFTNEQHVLNKYKAVAARMLHAPKNKANKSKAHDYSLYKRNAGNQ